MLKVIEFGVLEAEPESQAKIEPAGMPLWEIGEGCSWPISQDSERLLFCGQRKFGGRSYCAHHLAIAYQPESRSARSARAAERLALPAASEAAGMGCGI